MRQTVTFPPYPSNEPGQVLGSFDYDVEKAKEEAHEFISLIKRDLGCPDGDCQWIVGSHTNELGTHYTISYQFEGKNLDHRRYAHVLSVNLPREWDLTSINNLGLILIK